MAISSQEEGAFSPCDSCFIGHSADLMTSFIVFFLLLILSNFDGRAASGEALTEDEELALRMQYDGTIDADRAETDRIRKQEFWALYSEDHRRGAGNTMNRG